MATPWTYFLHLSLSSVILTDSSTESPVHVYQCNISKLYIVNCSSVDMHADRQTHRQTCSLITILRLLWSLSNILPIFSGKSGPKDQVALHYYYTSPLHWCTTREVLFRSPISRHADGISRYSVPPSASPLLPLPIFSNQLYLLH